MASEEKETFTNILETAVIPIDLRKAEVVFGAAEYVFFEVFTHWMLMYFFKFERRSFMELAAIHTVSLPFIGGAAAFVEFPHAMGYEAPWGDIVQDGAKGIPAVFAAQYVVNTALKGLHAPSIKFKEVLTTCAAKVLSRILLSGGYYALPAFFRNNLDILDMAFAKEFMASRLKSDKAVPITIVIGY